MSRSYSSLRADNMYCAASFLREKHEWKPTTHKRRGDAGNTIFTLCLATYNLIRFLKLDALGPFALHYNVVYVILWNLCKNSTISSCLAAYLDNTNGSPRHTLYTIQLPTPPKGGAAMPTNCCQRLLRLPSSRYSFRLRSSLLKYQRRSMPRSVFENFGCDRCG